MPGLTSLASIEHRIVIQDWGAALGFNRTARYPASVQGVCYMEAMVRPRYWDRHAAGASSDV